MEFIGGKIEDIIGIFYFFSFSNIHFLVPDIKYIINYDMPHALVRYVHRIGRTARAGTFGTSIVLLTEEV